MSKFRTVSAIVISGGIGGLAAVLSLHFILPPPAPQPVPVARAFVDGDLRKVQIQRDRDLSFKIPVSINGKTVQMLVDTGANVTVLTRSDANGTGIMREEGDGHLDVRGINKSVSRLRRVGLKTVQLGPISIESVPIAVDDSGELAMSILGQDAFCNLRRITIENNELELMHDSDIATGCET
jgi:clan AA aspartic protease (TIGR02281 family)